MVSIKEVAEKSGFSISTVSYAISGNRKISENAKQKILAVAEELHYSPKLAARALRSRKTKIIGVYISGFQGEFYGDLLDGIQKTLTAHGYDTIVTSGLRAHLFLTENLVDGAIILDNRFTDAELKIYLDQGHKIVVLDRDLQHENLRTALLDNGHGSELAISYLLEAHCDSIALLSGPEGNYDVEKRLKTALETLDKRHQKYILFEGDFMERSGYSLASTFLELSVSHHLGIYFFNDEMALGFYKYCEERALDISTNPVCVGFDNTRLSSLLHPKLASIRYRKHIWGQSAAELLIQMIEGKETENIVVKTDIDAKRN